jgi:excisionase family DNA binding protein
MASAAHPSLPFDEAPDPPRRHDDRLLSVEELADYLEVPVKTIYTWRHRNTGPKGFRVGKHVRFR